MSPTGRPEGEAKQERSPARPLAELLRARLAALAPAVIEIDDDSAEHAGHPGAAGGGGHFSVLIVSEAFSGRPTLARHRAVMATVADLIPHPVHALEIRAYAPDEFPSPR